MVLRNFRSHFRERHGESNCGRWVPLILYDRFFVGGVGFLVIEEPQKTFCSFPAEKLAEDPEIDQKPPYVLHRTKETRGLCLLGSFQCGKVASHGIRSSQGTGYCIAANRQKGDRIFCRPCRGSPPSLRIPRPHGRCFSDLTVCATNLPGLRPCSGIADIRPEKRIIKSTGR